MTVSFGPASGQSPTPVKSPQALVDNVVSQASSLQQAINNASVDNENLTISFYALVAWVIIITLALLAVGIVTYRRWKRSSVLRDGQESSFASSMSGSMAGETKVNLAGVNMCGVNSGFNVENESPIVSVHARVGVRDCNRDNDQTASPVNSDIVTTSGEI